MQRKQKRALAVGAGVAVLAAAAAGAYFMSSKKNRRKVKTWVSKMQKEVVKELGKARATSQTVYNKAVDTVAKNYRNLKNVDSDELAAAADQLKRHWQSISKEVRKASGTVKRLAPKAKRTARKVVSKSRSRTRK